MNTYLLPEFWENRVVLDLDSTATANKLLGSWKLTHRYCCPESTTGGALNNVEHEGYWLLITPEKIRAFVDGELIQETEWFLQTYSAPAFRIEADTFVSHISGQILFSDDRVLFYNSPTDGADNYYEKIAED